MSNDQEQVNTYFYTESILSSIDINSYSQMSQSNLTYTPPADKIFRSEWLRFPEFHGWLHPVVGNIFKAWCIVCERIFHANLKSLRLHGFSKRHLRMMYGSCVNAHRIPVPLEDNMVTGKEITYGIAEVTNKENKSSLASQVLHTNETNPAEKIIYEMTTKSKHDKYVAVSPLPIKDYNHNGGTNASSSNTKYIQIEMNVLDKYGSLVSVYTEYHKQKDTDNDDYYEVSLQSNDYSYEKMDQKYEGALCKAIVSKSAPFWKATAFVNGKVTELKLDDYRGRYLVLFFYPQNFSQIYPNELIALSSRLSEFRALNAEVVACSVDSYLSHQVWSHSLCSDGWIAVSEIPLLSDPTHAISKSYGCFLNELGHSLRAHYIIDMDGILRHMTINDLPFGDITEILRLLEAFQLTDETETLCPADWKPGEPTIF